MFGDATDALLRLHRRSTPRTSRAPAATSRSRRTLAPARGRRAGDAAATITTQVLGCDAKRLHIFHRCSTPTARRGGDGRADVAARGRPPAGPGRPGTRCWPGPERSRRPSRDCRIRPVPGVASGFRAAREASTQGFTFDFNGTLSDDEPIMYAVFAELFADLGRPLSEADYRHHLAGLSDEAIISNWMGDRDDLAELVAQRVAVYSKPAWTTAPPFSGRRAGGRAAGGRPRAAGSRVRGHCRRDPAGAGRSRTGRSVLRGVISADDVVHGKPHPGGISAGAAAAGRRGSRPGSSGGV